MATQPAPQQPHSAQELQRQIATLQARLLRDLAAILTLAADSNCTCVEFDQCFNMLRQHKVIHETELAQLAGVGASTLHGWARVQRWPPPERLRRILQAWARRTRQIALPEAARASGI